MSDMLKKFVTQAMEEQLEKKYPHIRCPAGMCAKVVQAKERAGGYEYTMRVQTEDLTDHPDFPELVGICSRLELRVGELAVVLMLYGGNSAVIVARYDI